MIFTISILFVLYTISCCMDGEDLKKLRIVMKKYLPLDAVLAAIEKMKDSVPHYITMAEKGAYIDCVNDAVDKIHSLEAKEVDFWHKQSEEDIDDSIIGWSMHSFICLMKDGTTQEFTGIQDESYEGGISKHLDCVDDNYEWEYDDIVYWIEIPMIKAQKGE